jgi:hypothetical protein
VRGDGLLTVPTEKGAKDGRHSAVGYRFSGGKWVAPAR